MTPQTIAASAKVDTPRPPPLAPGQAPPEPPPPAAHTRAEPERWAMEKRQAFSALAPAALCLVATDGPVSVLLWGPDGIKHRLGHNRGIWPAKIARTAAWKDSITQAYDKSPFPGLFLGTQWRLWTRSEDARDQLAEAVLGLIAERSEADGGMVELVNGFRDLGPELDLALFQLEAVDIARRMQITVWDDGELSRFLDRVVAEAETIRATGRDRGRGPVIDRAIVAAMKAERGAA